MPSVPHRLIMRGFLKLINPGPGGQVWKEGGLEKAAYGDVILFTPVQNISDQDRGKKTVSVDIRVFYLSYSPLKDKVVEKLSQSQTISSSFVDSLNSFNLLFQHTVIETSLLT